MPEMETRPRRATLSDVAREAGVSVGTASKALNDRFDVNEQTRQRVLRVAAGLNFRPNALARGLLAGRTQTVGVITNDLDGRFAPRVVVGIENALGADASTVLLSITRGDAALEAHYLRSFLERRVDGIVMLGDIPESRSPVTDLDGTPVVYAFAPSRNPDDVSVVPDNIRAGELAVEHLRERGRRDVLYLGGDAHHLAARDRGQGVLNALRAAGVPASPATLLYGDWLERWGWDAVGALLASSAPFDGLVCGNDQIARGAIDRLLAEGIAVPDSVAVAGIDNWEALALFGRHPITSVDMDLEELGARAARQLLGGADDAGGVQRHAGHVVARWSTLGG